MMQTFWTFYDAATTLRTQREAHWHAARFRGRVCVYCECLGLLHDAALAFCDQTTTTF